MGELLAVKVIPNAPKNRFGGFENGRLKVYIKALPADNAANEELISFLSEELKIAKSKISILKGKTSRLKLLQIEGSIHLK